MSTDSLSELIRLRVTPHQLQRYTAAAALESRSLSDYLRRRLDVSEQTMTELQAIRSLIVEYRSTGQSAGNEDKRLLACAIESLLLLRAIAPPQALRSVHGDLQRLGLKPFAAL